MSQENVEIVRRAVEAWSRSDSNAVVADFAAEGVVDLSRAVGPTQGTYGREAAREIWDDFAEAWQAMRIECDEFVEVDDKVVTPLTLHARGRGGIQTDAKPTWVWTLRHQQVIRAEMYQSRDEALEAVGLRE